MPNVLSILSSDFEPVFALDTEFVWNRTYYAKLGLVQVSAVRAPLLSRLPYAPPGAIPFREPRDGEAPAVLLDPLECDRSPVREFLEDLGSVKVLHDAQQDLQHLVRWTGARPASVFDTRLAAGFCGLPSTLSLAKLVEAACGVSLPKTETLTDWTRRPLTPKQLEYAAQDVAYLPRAARWLEARARELGTDAWLAEEMERLDDPALYAEPPPEEAWRRLKLPGFVRADPRAMHRARELAAWRERLARERNLPRKWVADDEVLVRAAMSPDVKVDAIPRKQLPPAFARGFAATLAACARTPDADLPPAAPPPERDPTLHDRATALLKELAPRAEAAHVDPALLATRAEATAWLANPDDPSHPLNRGWRREVARLS